MKPLTKEYIQFESSYLKDLTDLWYNTLDEDLRLVILKAREVLKNIYEKSILPL